MGDGAFPEPPVPPERSGGAPDALPVPPERSAGAPDASPPAAADGPQPPEPGALPPRWAGYPGVPLTAAPLTVWGALGIAAYGIVANTLLTLFVGSAGVSTAARAGVLAISRATGIGRMELAAVASAIVMILAYAIILAPILVIARRRRVSFSAMAGLRRARLGPVVLIGGVAVLLAACLVVEFELLLTRIGVSNAGNTTELVRVFGATPLGIVILFVLGAGVAPFAEEVIFRGVVFASLRESWPEGWAIVVSAALFGIVHLQPLAMVPAALIGIVLAKVYSSTRSLWASILVHAVYNALALTLALATTHV